MRRNLLICMVLLSMVLVGGYLFLKHEKHQPKSKAAYSEAYQKEESFNYFNYRMLVDEFPFDQSLKSHYFREFIHHKSNLSGRYPYRQLPEWESLGPSHIAGRALCLAIHPFDTNQLWMGSAGSGLWKSETGGVGQNAWTHVPLTFPVSAVSSIAIQMSNPQIIYLGTGEVYNLEGADGGIITRTLRGSRGLGILKSTDGGKSWNISLNWSSSPSTAVWKIIIHPQNPNIIFAATNLGIYKSLDGGDNWSSILNLPLTMDLLIDESEPEILYTGVGGVNNTHYGVYKTLDGGNRWELVSSPNDTLYQGRIMLARYKKNPKRIYALYSDAFRSIGMMRTLDGFDQTKFYTPVKNISSHQGWYAKGLLIKDDDSTKILAGGVDVYLDTTGTGNQFFNLILRKIKVHADVHDVISNPLDPDKVYLATDGGLFRSDDFAETFYACNGGFLSTQFYTGSVSIRSDQLVGGLQDNRSAVLRDPQPWSLIHLGDGTFNAIDPANDSILYLSSQYQNLYRSTTMGTSWKQLIPPNNQAAFVAPFALHPRVKGLLYSGGNHLLRSYDEGNNWDTIALPESGSKITALEVSASEPNLVVFATIHTELGNSNLYISNARGEILRSIGASIPDRFIRDICIDPSDPRHFIIALGGSGIPGVMESYDAGFSWMFTENTGLPDIPIHSLLIDPKYPEIYYAGTEFGLYASPNKGKNWISFNTHPYDLVPVYDLKYSEIRKKLILFTHGYGAFQLPLLDPTLITSSEQVDSRAWIFDPLEKAIILPDDSKFNEIYLISLSGQVQKLFAEGNKISLRSTSPGIYFLKTKSTGSKPERIFLPE